MAHSFNYILNDMLVIKLLVRGKNTQLGKEGLASLNLVNNKGW